MSNETSLETIIVGGGQAGLAVGYFLARQKQNFLILDGGSRTGDSWRSRWDSLRLFTPSQFDGLPGRPFPQPAYQFPTKDETADYLEAYAREFALPLRYGVKVEALDRQEGGYRLRAGTAAYLAKNVIVATGAYQVPHVPGVAGELNPGTMQLHASAYRNPRQIAGERVLVVGAGNSGAEIALELAGTGKTVWLAGRDVGHIPANKLGRVLGGRPYWWFISNVLSEDTFVGRKMKAQVLTHGNPLIATKRSEVISAGIGCTPRVSGSQNGRPQLEDGRVLEVEAVVWATGYRPDFSWIHLPVFDAHGLPRHKRGIVPEAPGLYFAGLHFQRALTSALLGGVGRDAQFVVDHLLQN